MRIAGLGSQALRSRTVCGMRVLAPRSGSVRDDLVKSFGNDRVLQQNLERNHVERGLVSGFENHRAGRPGTLRL